PRRQGTVGLAWPEEGGLQSENLEIPLLALAGLDRGQKALRPRQPVAAGRAPATGLLREEVLEIAQHADGAGVIVEDDHGARAEAAADLLQRVEVQGNIEMLVEHEVGGGAARQQCPEREAIAHAAC